MGSRISRKLSKSNQPISIVLLPQVRHLRPLVRLADLFLVMVGMLCVVNFIESQLCTISYDRRKRRVADCYVQLEELDSGSRPSPPFPECPLVSYRKRNPCCTQHIMHPTYRPSLPLGVLRVRDYLQSCS